jgi:hypothetical protein
MKPAPSTLVRENTLPVLETMEFGIGDPRVVMEINAGQYSDIETAIIREYSTNAYDSHVMGGHTDPIEVTLPTVFENFFIVKDHGVGMSRDTFRQIYTQFGISDKRERNDANGQMGIGSKSGAAYTPQFWVESVKDGIKVQAKIRRGDDWALYLDVLAEDFTDEPNGTTIKIPIHNVDEFRQKAFDFYKFWLPGRVLIDGKPSVHHVGEKIAEGLYFSKDWSTSYVVLANAPYRIHNSAALFRDSRLSSLNFVAYVDDIQMDDGAAPVQFTPSREDLKYTDRTKNTLRKIIRDFEADLLRTAQAEIDAATTHAEAYTAWSKWKDTLHGRLFSDLTFKGDKFKEDFPLFGMRYSVKDSGYRGRSNVNSIQNYGVGACSTTLFVTDFNVQTSSSVKMKVKDYIDLFHKDDNLTKVVFTHATSFDCVWVDWTKQHIVTWADLKAAMPKLPRGQRSYVPGSGRVPGSWDYWTKDGLVRESHVPTDKTLLWISKHDTKRYSEQAILRSLDSDAVVLIVPRNRLEKLRRENPQIENFVNWAREQVVKDGASLLSAEAKKVFRISGDRIRWINALDMSRIDDPELKSYKSLFDRKDELLAEYNRHRNLANMLHMLYNGFKEYNASGTTEDFYKKYPLLSSVSLYREIDDDVYLYMNAKHKAESENK